MSQRVANGQVPSAVEDTSLTEWSKFQKQEMEKKREHAGSVHVPGSRWGPTADFIFLRFMMEGPSPGPSPHSPCHPCKFHVSVMLHFQTNETWLLQASKYPLGSQNFPPKKGTNTRRQILRPKGYTQPVSAIGLQKREEWP